jgi:prefoldin alpha subunit|tara:strand:- start:3463 stop:4011 length:549 start_codon:yes stop_codon:yes gene_type:complete
MVDRTELQNKARLVESHRQHLEELQRRMDQIVSVINEHQVTEEVLARLISMAESGESKAHVSIGAGVTLNYQHNAKSAGTAMVDLGSGVFGERNWQEVIDILAKRRTEFNDLQETLLKQATAIEEKLGQLAKEFNEAAEKLQVPESQPPSQTSPQSPDETNKPAPKQRRRGSMFGSELTLDD